MSHLRHLITSLVSTVLSIGIAQAHFIPPLTMDKTSDMIVGENATFKNGVIELTYIDFNTCEWRYTTFKEVDRIQFDTDNETHNEVAKYEINEFSFTMYDRETQTLVFDDTPYLTAIDMQHIDNTPTCTLRIFSPIETKG